MLHPTYLEQAESEPHGRFGAIGWLFIALGVLGLFAAPYVVTWAVLAAEKGLEAMR